MPLFSKSVYAGYTLEIPMPPGTLTNTWTVGVNNLAHTINAKTEIGKYIATLKLNTNYKIRYEVYDYVNCTVQLKVGDQLGTVRSSAGIYEETFTIHSDLERRLVFISDGILKIRNIEYEEKVFVTNELLFEGGDNFENKSWTLSYSFNTNKWISWHSYLPTYYIHSQNNLYSFVAKVYNIWKHHLEGKFQTFYGTYFPHIVEYVKSSGLEDTIIEHLQLQTKARKWDAASRQYIDERYVTFNKIILSNNRQCTGELTMIVKNTQGNNLWLNNQVVETQGSILIARNEGNWDINDLRDYVIDDTKPLFSSAWSVIRNNYFIDKLIQPNIIDFNKNWYELENFRDKFVVIRLKFSTFDDVNLILNFSIDTSQNSER